MGRYSSVNLLGNQCTRIYDKTTAETIDILGAKAKFYDDFLNTQFMTAAAGIAGWTVKDTGAQNVAPVILANQPGGVIKMGGENTNEKQESGIYWGDALNFNLDKGVIFETRLNCHHLAAGPTEIYFGLANAYVEGPIAASDDGPTIQAFFCFDGDAAATIHTDDTSTHNAAVDAATTVTVDTFYIYRIEVLDVTSVKFYINGARVASGTTFNMANGSNVVVQPYFMVHKESDAGTIGAGEIQIDYCKVWQLTR